MSPSEFFTKVITDKVKEVFDLFRSPKVIFLMIIYAIFRKDDSDE